MLTPRRSCQFLGLSLLVTGYLGAAPARAHFVLQSPAAAHEQGPLGDPQKAPPCGDNGSAVATGALTAYQAGDVVTALFQPLSFTVLGATGKNEEINFEAQGITLAQALARAGGLQDSRSDAKGVFIFRFEPANALKWPKQPAATTPEGKVPVIYRIDLKNPY